MITSTEAAPRIPGDGREPGTRERMTAESSEEQGEALSSPFIPIPISSSNGPVESVSFCVRSQASCRLFSTMPQAQARSPVNQVRRVQPPSRKRVTRAHRL